MVLNINQREGYYGLDRKFFVVPERQHFLSSENTAEVLIGRTYKGDRNEGYNGFIKIFSVSPERRHILNW
jgi:hypothetical protein